MAAFSAAAQKSKTPTSNKAGNTTAATALQGADAPAAGAERRTTATAAAAQQTTAPATADSATTKPLAAPATAADIEARMKSVQDDAAIAADEKKKVLEILQQALDAVQAADTWSGKAAEFAKAAESTPARIAALKEALAKPAADPAPDLASTTTAAQVEQLAARVQADLDAARKRAADIRDEQAGRAGRRADLPKLLAAAQQKLDDLKKEDAAVAGATGPEADAVALRQAARQRALESELASHEGELRSYDAAGELPTLLSDEAAREVAFAEQQLTAASAGRQRQTASRGRRRGEGGAARPHRGGQCSSCDQEACRNQRGARPAARRIRGGRRTDRGGAPAAQ